MAEELTAEQLENHTDQAKALIIKQAAEQKALEDERRRYQEQQEQERREYQEQQESKKVKLELVRLAKEVLVENSRSKAVDERDVSASDITTYASALYEYVNK